MLEFRCHHHLHLERALGISLLILLKEAHLQLYQNVKSELQFLHQLLFVKKRKEFHLHFVLKEIKQLHCLHLLEDEKELHCKMDFKVELHLQNHLLECMEGLHRRHHHLLYHVEWLHRRRHFPEDTKWHLHLLRYLLEPLVGLHRRRRHLPEDMEGHLHLLLHLEESEEFHLHHRLLEG